MLCAVTPYEGSDPFIFFSYCHDNESLVYPIIEQMAADGYRIWFDNGIHPGEDWQQVIAEHIYECSICVAAVTKESAESHNCRNEITFVVNNNKLFVPIMLQEFKMMLGMRMQLSSGQWIKRYEIKDDGDFYSRLYQAEGMDICRGKVSLLNQNILLARRQQEQELNRQRKEETERAQREKAYRDLWGDQKSESRDESDHDPQPEFEFPPVKQPEADVEKTPKDPLNVENQEKQSSEVDVEDSIENWSQNRRKKATGDPSEALRKALIMRCSDGTTVPLLRTSFSFFSTGSELQACSIRNAQPCMIYQDNGDFLLAIPDALEFVLNGKRLLGEKETLLKSPSFIDISGERYLFLCDDDAIRAKREQQCAWLECQETGECRALGAMPLELGRGTPWPGGSLSDCHVSYEHGSIIPLRGGYGYRAHGEERTNGTYCNGERVMPKEKIGLLDGDVIGLSRSCSLVYHAIAMQWEVIR